MQVLKFIFLLTPIVTLGQRNDTTVKTILNIYDFSDSRFDIDSNGFHGTTKEDTTYYTDGKIASIGHYAIARNSRMSGNKFGVFTKYYNNGQIKSQGSYAMQSLLFYLSPAKGLRLESSYKIGAWTYYYESGQIQAKGKYQIVTSKASTGIPNQYSKNSTTTDEWLFFNPDGSKAIDKQKLIAGIEWNPNCD
jgi:antitoxin component YwqK of YwqJK toxin-antitoxin module